MINLSDPFGDGAKHGTVIHLLKCFTVGEAIVNLPHKQHHRRAVLHRDMHTGAGVGGPRPTGDKAHAGLAGQLAIGLGHHRSATFLAADDIGDAAVIQPVQRREETFARHRKHPFHAQSLQMIAQDFTAVPLHICHLPMGIALTHSMCQQIRTGNREPMVYLWNNQ